MLLTVICIKFQTKISLHCTYFSMILMICFINCSEPFCSKMLLLIAFAFSCCMAQLGIPSLESFTRLPDNVRPINYKLEIAIFTKNLTTRGEVMVYLEITNPTKNITLHASERLSIIGDRVKVREKQTSGWKDVAVLSQSEHTGPAEQYWIHLDRQLTKGSHVYLNVPFKGKISDGKRKANQNGLYMGDNSNLNLVTCSWWNEIWINEAITSYWESFGLLALYPPKLVAKKQMLERTYKAFKADTFPRLQMVPNEKMFLHFHIL